MLYFSAERDTEGGNMRTIKTYACKCGEDFYEDDECCINCGEPIDKSKLVEQELMEIKHGKVPEVDS